MVDPLRRRSPSENSRLIKTSLSYPGIRGGQYTAPLIPESFLKIARGGRRLFHKIYDKLEESISLVFFLLIFALMTMGVFNRYLLGKTFAWNIELCRYSFVWLTFVGAAFVRKQDSHIKIEILFKYINQRLSPGAQKVLWIFKKVLTIAFLIALIYLGFILANKTWRFKSQAMQIPQFFLYISVTIGAALYLLREIPDSIRYYREYFSRR